ncbi:MAG: hypothetical protein JHC33_01635 [Ignisphaera sp.]|nr:hypothetical protein [Ignisphaera sp.]
MNVLIIDVETTVSNKGNPFDLTNKMVSVGCLTNGVAYDLYTDDEGWQSVLQTQIDTADTLVGFNIKFDLHWLRRYGINFEGKRIWDCQLAEFILDDMRNPYPSLDDAADKYGFEKKLDVVKNEYWDKGVDTDAIPRDVLSAYLIQDLLLTEQVYVKQKEQFDDEAIGKYRLFKLQCLDLLVLEEIEWNGILFNADKARQKAAELEIELAELSKTLMDIVGNVPLNINSNDHLSCLLYGGIIKVDYRVPIGVYKTGAKVGEVRYKVLVKEYELPQLVKPLKGSETKKEGYWKVNDDILRQLKLSKEAKKIVELISKYSELDKLRGTYLLGWSNLIDTMNWEKDMIHGNLNMCVATTGRLSSTKPNLQNADPLTKEFMETRYE